MSKGRINLLTIPYMLYEKILHNLQKNPENMAVLKVRKNFLPEKRELLCTDAVFHTPLSLRNQRKSSSSYVELGLGSSSFTRAGYIPLMLNFCSHNSDLYSGDFFSQIVLEESPEPDIFSGMFFYEGIFEPVHLIQIQGPKMIRIKSTDARKIFSEKEFYPDREKRWSRLIGGMGGKDIWEKFCQLNFCIVGLGRNGSLMANSLARMGVKNLTFIDPDVIELHNLDIMDNVSKKDVGENKVYAIANNLLHFREDLKIKTFAGSILSTETIKFIMDSDIIISCVDNNIARFWINMISVFFIKPLLDIGSGIFNSGKEIVAGADVKLSVPGDKCLYCMGSFPEIKNILSELSEELKGKPHRNLPWNSERAGSLRSINQMGVHLGLKILEGFLSGSQKNSIWLRLMCERDVIPSIYELKSEITDCPCCKN